MLTKIVAKLSGLPRVTVHPVFLAYLTVLFFCGAERQAFLSVGVVLLHEVGHFVVAKKVGIKLSDVVLYPYGAVMETDCDTSEPGLWKVAIAGPLVNLALALLGLLVAFAGGGALAIDFVNANLTVCLFNLLPVYPLDGGRAVLAWSKKPLRTIKILRIAGIAVASILFLLFALSIVFGLNLTFGVMSVFLFIGAIAGVEREMGGRVAKLLLSRSKNYGDGVPVVTYACSETTPVHKVLQKLSPNRVTEIVIIGEDGKKRSLSEEDFLLFARTSPVGATLKDMEK